MDDYEADRVEGENAALEEIRRDGWTEETARRWLAATPPPRTEKTALGAYDRGFDFAVCNHFGLSRAAAWNKRQRDTAATIGYLAGVAFRFREEEIEARERGDHRAAIVPAQVAGEACTNLYKILRDPR